MVKEKYTGSLHKMVVTSDRDHLEMNTGSLEHTQRSIITPRKTAAVLQEELRLS
jgi:hypothetical protein